MGAAIVSCGFNEIWCGRQFLQLNGKEPLTQFSNINWKTIPSWIENLVHVLVPKNPNELIHGYIEGSSKKIEWIKVYHELMEQFLPPLLRFDENDFLRSALELHQLKTSASDEKWDAPRGRTLAASESTAFWLTPPADWGADKFEFHQLIASIGYHATQGPIYAPTVVKKIFELREMAKNLELHDSKIDEAIDEETMVMAIKKVVKKHAGST